MNILDMILISIAIILTLFVFGILLIFFYYVIKYKNVNFFTDGERSIDGMSRDEILFKLDSYGETLDRIKVDSKNYKQIPQQYKDILIINVLRFDFESITTSYIDNLLIPVLMRLKLFHLVSLIKNSENKRDCVKEHIIEIEDALISYIKINITLYGKKVNNQKKIK